jgi:hypothetical protein
LSSLLAHLCSVVLPHRGKKLWSQTEREREREGEREREREREDRRVGEREGRI